MTIKNTIATCLLVLLAAFAIQAQDQPTKWQSELSGEAHALGRGYFAEGKGASYQWQAETRLNLEGELSYGTRWKGQATVLGTGYAPMSSTW